MELSSRKPLVIGISSRALLDLEKENAVYEKYLKVSRAAAIEAFIKYQREHRDEIIPKGVAFPLVKALLELSKKLSGAGGQPAIEIVIISRNHPDCGSRILNSLAYHGVEIVKTAFTGGDPVLPELRMFEVNLFLSYEDRDVLDAGRANISAAKIFGGPCDSAPCDGVPLLAFDGDSTIFSDESDQAFLNGQMPGFIAHEKKNKGIPLKGGPMASFFRALAEIHSSGPIDNPPVKIALVTSRNFHTMDRPIDTLRSWGIQLDKAYAVGPMNKGKVLEHLKPLMFFDDNPKHCADAAMFAPTARVLMVTPIPTAIGNGLVSLPAQHALIPENGEPKSNFLLICRSYLNVKNGSGDIAVLEQWFDQRLAKRETAAVNALLVELEKSISGTPAGDDRPAKGAKNEKNQKLLSFLDDLERKHFG